MKQIFVNNAYARLAEDQGSSLVLTEQVNIPTLHENEYFLATLWTEGSRYGTNIEIVKVTAVNGNIWTVERAQEDTQQFHHPTGTQAELRLTAGSLNTLTTIVSSVSHIGLEPDPTKLFWVNSDPDNFGLYFSYHGTWISANTRQVTNTETIEREELLSNAVRIMMEMKVLIAELSQESFADAFNNELGAND